MISYTVLLTCCICGANLCVRQPPKPLSTLGRNNCEGGSLAWGYEVKSDETLQPMLIMTSRCL